MCVTMVTETRYSVSLESFVVNPSLDQIDKCRKCDLVQIANHYNLDLLKPIVKKELKGEAGGDQLIRQLWCVTCVS